MSRATPARLAQRRRMDRLFHLGGLAAVGFSALMLAFLLATIAANGLAGFTRAEVRLALNSPAVAKAATAPLPPGQSREAALAAAGLPQAVDRAAQAALGPDGATLLADGAWRELVARPEVLAGSTLMGRPRPAWLPASDRLAAALRGEGNPALVARARALHRQGTLIRAVDFGFLTRSDDVSPQTVGLGGALLGSLMTIAVTMALAFPVGVLAALYLEEFAPRTRWTRLIEISINNLAAVPSIIFGLLGLAVFLAAMPAFRSAPLIGGMTLALMTMPVIVITSRNAVAAVPETIRDAARGIGASPVQVVFDHVLPLALPGIMTGTIFGMARALGETAPLLLIGMRAFIAAPPSGLTAPATTLPVQIFLWSTEVDRGFVERTSAAILVLLAVLLSMNGLAIWLRARFENTFRNRW